MWLAFYGPGIANLMVAVVHPYKNRLRSCSSHNVIPQFIPGLRRVTVVHPHGHRPPYTWIAQSCMHASKG